MMKSWFGIIGAWLAQSGSAAKGAGSPMTALVMFGLMLGAVPLAVLDTLFSARMLISPAIMWAVWGAILGGVLGFWQAAPAYGLRSRRQPAITIPFIAMFLLMIGSWAWPKFQIVMLSRGGTLEGTWTGKYDDKPATLTMIYQKTSGIYLEFFGTLTITTGSGRVAVSVTGRQNLEKHTVSVQEINILEEPKKGFWFVGDNSGTIERDGRLIKGTGFNRSGKKYQWYFDKDIVRLR